MATKTWFCNNNIAGGHVEMAETDIVGTESYSSPNTGWIVSTGSTNHSEMEAGAGKRAASTFTATTFPDGSINTTLGDCFRTANAYTGNFASGNWEVHCGVAANSNGGAQDGRIRFRLLRGANANGSGATEITAAQQQCSLCSNISATQDSNLTFNPGAFSVSNEFIFVQIAWERTGAGAMTTSDIILRYGNSLGFGTRVISADFTATGPSNATKSGMFAVLQ